MRCHEGAQIQAQRPRAAHGQAPMNPTSLRQLPLRSRLIVSLATITLLFAGMLVTPRSAQPVEASSTPQQGLGVIVLVRDGTTLGNSAIDAFGLAIADDLGGGMYLLERKNAALTFAEYQAIASNLHNTDLFEIAAANGMLYALTAGATTALDDPDAELATGVTNSQTNVGWNLDIVDGALDGSYSVGPTGRGVYIYVIDSGVDPTHGDFTGRVLEIPGSDLVDGDDQPRPCTYQDGLGSHGHHVASTAGGFRYGLAKEAIIVPIRVFGCTGRATSANILQALNLARTDNNSRGNPPAVVNLSLGAPCLGDCATSESVYVAAIDSLVAAGVTVTVAAGNSGADACGFSPAFVPSAITIGNSTVADKRAPGSNYGSCLDLYAPGTAIPAADHRDRVGSMTETGTSMAAPLVAGAVALYLSSVANMSPAERPVAVRAFLMAHAASFASDKTPDADKRLQLPAALSANSSVVTGGGNLRLTFSTNVTGFAAADITITGTATDCSVNLTDMSASVYETGIACGGSGSATAVLAANSVALADTSDLGPNGTVTSAVVQDDGKIVLGGFFTSYNGTPAQYLVRLNADGSVDDTFAVGVGPDAGVQSLALQSDGKIIVGGDFTNFGVTAAAKMARLNSDGSLDTTFDVGTGPQNAPTTLLALASGDVLVGGTFSSFDGFAQDAIVLLDNTGTVDTTYTVTPDTYGHVFVLERLVDGKILVAGNFSGFGGVPTEDIALLNADLTVDGTFARGDDYYNHSIRDVSVQSDGKIVVSGTGLYPLDETQVDWDNRAFVERLSSSGSVDSSFAKALSNFMGGARTAMALLGDGSLLFGGDFSAINDSAVNPLVILTTSGSLEQSLPLDASVHNLFAYDDGILVVGSFTTYGSFARPGIMELNADGTLDMYFQRTTAPSTDLALPTLTFDSTGPALSSGIVPTSGSAGEAIFAFPYTEGIRSLTAGDLSVSGTATGCVVTSAIGAGNYYNAKVTCTGNGTVVVSLLANSSKDLAGNTGPSTTTASSPYSMTNIAATTTTTVAVSGGGGASPSTTIPAASGGEIAQPNSPVSNVPTTVPGRVQLPAARPAPTPTVTTVPAAPAAPIRTTSTRTSGQLAGSTLGVAPRRIGGAIASTNQGSVIVEVRNRKGRLVRTLAVNVDAGGKFTIFLPNGVYSVRIKSNDGPNKGRTLWNVKTLRVS